MLYRCAVALALLGPVLSASAAEPEGTPDDLYPGITYTRWRDASGPVRLHVVTVDLSSAEIDLLATASGQRGATPSAFAAAAGAVIAVNGDYFRPSDFTPQGLARGAAATWSGTRDDEVSGFVSFYKGVDGGNLAQGAAIALFLFPVLVGVAALMLRLARRTETSG